MTDATVAGYSRERALPGVQVLFAFFPAVPFAKGRPRVTHFQKDVFVVAFLGAAVSSEP
jgi:hypothetical protein